MVDKQPTFSVIFKELAVQAIQKQKRGTVIMILEDETSADLDRVTYKTLGDVKKSDWTSANYDLLTLAFLGNPTEVVVLKAETEFSDLQTKLNYYSNYTLCYPTASASDMLAIKNYINAQRQKNNYSIAVLGSMTGADAQYIVNFTTTGIKAKINDAEKTFTAGDYTTRIAGALSGLPNTRSLTYFELPEVYDCKLAQDADAEVKKGNLIILQQDGSFKLGRAVNSLATLTDGITEAFQKIRVSNIMDMIANDIISTFRLYYVGKYTNNYTNKLRFIGAINAYLRDLALEGLLEIENQNEVQISYEKTKSYLEGKGVDTSKMTYQEVITTNTGSRVLLDGVCSPTDTMEDLDLGMYLFQALSEA